MFADYIEEKVCLMIRFFQMVIDKTSILIDGILIVQNI